MTDSENSTTLSDVSRRNLLAIAAATPLSALSPSRLPEANDPVLALWHERQRLHAQAVGLCRRWGELEDHLIKEIGFPKVLLPCTETAVETVAFSHDDIDRACATGKLSADSQANLHAQLSAHQALWDREGCRTGFFEADRRQLEAWKKEAHATRTIFATPATTLTGIRMKIALMVQLCRTGCEDPDFPLPQLRSTLADIERLQLAKP